MERKKKEITNGHSKLIPIDDLIKFLPDSKKNLTTPKTQVSVTSYL